MTRQVALLISPAWVKYKIGTLCENGCSGLEPGIKTPTLNDFKRYDGHDCWKEKTNSYLTNKIMSI